VGTTVGSLLGTSTVTSYVESATGIGAGARTGLANMATGSLLLAVIFFTPFVRMIAGGMDRGEGLVLYPVVAPALIIVGALLAMKIAPAYIEYGAVKKAVRAIATGGQGGTTVAEVRRSFDRRAQIDDVTVITGEDLEITKEGGEVVVSFAYTRDETNHMADILLPEATDLESLQLIQIGNTKFIEQLWKHQGWAIRQPAVEPVVDCMDMTDIATELARRADLLEPYNQAINRGAAGMKLSGDGFDYRLDPQLAHRREAIWDAVCKAASHSLSGGEAVHDLDWFKAHGYMLRPFPQLNWYLYPRLKDNGIRFELPYQERILRHGTQLARRLHEIGVQWWDRQLEEYEPLPSYRRFPDIWIDYAREVGRDPAEFPFWAVTARSMQYAWGANVGIPLINEVAANVAGHRGVIINRTAARARGIADGDPVIIESVADRTRGTAVLREGIRPDTILMIGQFDHWATPVAKDLGVASLNTLTSLSLSLTDSTGSTADLARVKITRDPAAP